ncbi:hypothetical protein CCACVL1_00224 [Corchorus capsularis]|uniref:Uncharacterized protein n=1 Tax=Corchorus capsularis TaxID=210143 RepID=A0A1R3KXY2_COCAP|nr:hypothetical protein CCACVL1_00224 [Corchorus capsularis]
MVARQKTIAVEQLVTSDGDRFAFGCSIG